MNQHLSTNPNPIQTQITGIATVAAPLLLLGSTLAYVAFGDGLNAGEVGGAVQVWAFIAMGVAITGLCRTFEHIAPKAAAVLNVMGVVAAAVGSGFGIDSMQASIFDTGSLMEADSSAVPFALNIPGLMTPAALAALGIVLARTGTAPKALGRILTIGALLFPASRLPDIEALAIVSDLLIGVSLVPIGLGLLSRRRIATAVPAAALS